ncbi:MAG: Rieske 2Fe-2S domain-containing protein [Pseudomonadota bacterium]
MLTQAETELSSARPNRIDFDRISEFHYLGNYVRKLPVNMTRMIENAYDWEHLPYVHASSFSSIELIASGPWGWRAKIGLPQASGSAFQLIDLLVARDKNYWVSTVYSGPGAGVEIHTQASPVSDEEIEVDVRFYLPEAPKDKDQSVAALRYLSEQYARLYDEDTELMSGRQRALDERAREQSRGERNETLRVGAVSELAQDKVHMVESAAGQICVRQWQGDWIAHAATCPHLLGPLQDSSIDAAGFITCPWHGYRFDVRSGANLEGKCRSLSIVSDPFEKDGTLYVRIDSGL